MPDIVVFTQHRGTERVWVKESEVEWWLSFWGKQGVPAARWKDYLRWGRSFYPPTDSAERITLRRPLSRRGTPKRTVR